MDAQTVNVVCGHLKSPIREGNVNPVRAGAEKSNASPVPTRDITNPRRKSSPVIVRVVFVEVMGAKFDHSSVTGAGSPTMPPCDGRIPPWNPCCWLFVTEPGELSGCNPPPGPTTICTLLVPPLVLPYWISGTAQRASTQSPMKDTLRMTFFMALSGHISCS